MKFPKPLIQGFLVNRYKRFFADVEYVNELGQTILATIHVPNTGSLKSVIEKNQKQNCWFSLHQDPEKKLKGTLEAVQVESGAWVGVNTSNPNKIVNEVIQKGIVEKSPFLDHWSEYQCYKPEYKISKETRLDGVLVFKKEDLEKQETQKHFIEIKNTTYKSHISGQSHAQFPDAVTERGQKHLLEMMQLIKQGHQCELIFTVQRSDVEFFSACKNLDPKYSELLRMAYDLGLIITPLLVEITQSEVRLTNKKLKLIWP